MAQQELKELRGKCLARERVFRNGVMRYPTDQPFPVTLRVPPNEDGSYPTFEEALPPSLEYYGPLGETPPVVERDAAVPKQPLAPGEGAPQVPLPDKSTRLLSAYQMLDPDNEAHWTRDGRPRCAALAEICGDRVSQEDVDQHLKNLRRPTTPTAEAMAEAAEEEATGD